MKVKIELKLYLVIFFILYPNILWAEFVPEETARQAAVNQMNKNIQARALQRQQGEPHKAEVEQQAAAKITEDQIAGTFTATKKDIFVYYVFNFSPEGWAIISADDAAYPVIAYSESGFYDPNLSNQPPALTAWMDNVAAEIADAIIGGLAGLPDAVEAWKQFSVAPSDFVADLSDTATAQSVPPLIQSTWGGGGFIVCLPSTSSNSYDKYCPWEYTDGTHNCKDYCPAGCTVTAMAQIMRYWQWPLFGQGSHGYDPPYDCSEECEGFDWREVDFSQQYYDWSDSSMPLHTASDAIAILMRDIGVAVEMNYTPSGSGALPDDAFQNYFRYDAGPLEYKSNYSDTSWISKIKADLDSSRPIYYVGHSADYESGHAFVCDGYDLSGSFHFNWGWFGYYDGYFTLDDLTPGGSNFSYRQKAVFDIEPDSPLEVYVDDDYSAVGGNDGHTWLFDAFNNIQDAMNFVHLGGTVYVAAGTYNEAIDFKGKALRLYGIGGPGVTTIDANGIEGAYHVVQCVSGEGADIILEGFTITGGNANGTGSDGYGGGMYNTWSNPEVTNCTFADNFATFRGGGIHNDYGSFSPTLTNCTFISNHSDVDGGAIYNSSHCSTTITKCTFSGNSAELRGGGMYNGNCKPTVTNCLFTDNWAGQDGGGIFNYGYYIEGLTTVTNSTFISNFALNGNALACDSYYMDYPSNHEISNCIFYDGDAIWNNDGSTINISYTNLWGGTAACYDPFGAIVWGVGNIDADPCFAWPGYWGNVNDPNITVEPNDPNAVWIDGDYHLKSQAGRWDANSQTWVKDAVTSPCIDAGDPNSDWRGEYWPHGEHINMGAYGGTAEASMSLSEAGNIADLNIDGLLCYRDMKLLTDKWLYEAMLLSEDLSRDGIVNFTDFAIFAHFWELPARNPNPADGAMGVSITADLSWIAGRGATSHDVYFGTSSPPPFILNQTDTTFDPGTMAYDTKYYWRIDEVGTSGTTTGPIWSFTTTMSPPP